MFKCTNKQNRKTTKQQLNVNNSISPNEWLQSKKIKKNKNKEEN